MIAIPASRMTFAKEKPQIWIVGSALLLNPPPVRGERSSLPTESIVNKRQKQPHPFFHRDSKSSWSWQEIEWFCSFCCLLLRHQCQARRGVLFTGRMSERQSTIQRRACVRDSTLRKSRKSRGSEAKSRRETFFLLPTARKDVLCWLRGRGLSDQQDKRNSLPKFFASKVRNLE